MSEQHRFVQWKYLWSGGSQLNGIQWEKIIMHELQTICHAMLPYYSIHTLLYSSTLLGTPTLMRPNTNIWWANHMTATQCIWARKHAPGDLLRFKLNIRMSKNGNFTLNMEHQLPAIQDQETGATICTGSPKLDNRRLDNNCLVSWLSQHSYGKYLFWMWPSVHCT